MSGMTTIEVHGHVCPECWQPWEHIDEVCSCKRVPKYCNSCVTRLNEKEVFMEMARKMPIPHDHRCVICELQWEHNDKICAIAEHYWLECESCMKLFFTRSHFCPKCGGESEELKSPTSAVCYVCRDCQYFFSAQSRNLKIDLPAQKDTRITMHKCICPKCGTHFASNKPDAHLCGECGYWLRFHGKDHPEEEDDPDEYDSSVG